MATMLFLRGPAGGAPDAFVAELRQRLETTIAASRAAVRQCVVNVNGPPPEGLPGFLRAGTGGAIAPYDAIVVVDADESVSAALVDAATRGAATAHVYRVTGTVIFERGMPPAGKPTPGIKYLRGLIHHADMAVTAARRSWTLHAPLATRVHVGCSRYIQWWVDAVLTPDAPPFFGAADLHFPTDRDMVERFFDDAKGPIDVARDTSHFIAAGPPRHYVRELDLLS